MKTIIILFTFILPFSSDAQTYIGLTTGYHFTEIEKGSLYRLEFDSEGFDNKRLTFGLDLEYYVHDYFSLIIASNWSKYEVRVSDVSTNPYAAISFNYIRNSVIIGYDFSKFRFNTGLEYNFATNLNLIHANENKENLSNQEHISGVIGLSYRWENFEGLLNYHQGFVERKYDDLQALSSIELGFRYRLKIFDKGKGGKKVKCPKL